MAEQSSGLGVSIASDQDDRDTQEAVIVFPGNYYDIVIIGRTGLGKSTLGNKLLQVHDTSYITNREFSTSYVRGKGISEPNIKFDGFPTSEDKDVEKDLAVTKECQLVANESTSFEAIRVLDTPGFHTKKSGMTMYQANLQKFRWIVREQVDPDKNLAVKRLLYFLPDRSTDWKSDGIVQEELELMHYFFGTAVFSHMVAIATQAMNSKYQQFEFTPADEEIVRVKFHKAVKAVTGGKISEGPPVIYIGYKDSSDVALNKIKQARVIGKEEYFKPEFRKNVCSRCSGEVQYATSSSGRAIPIGFVRDPAQGIEEYEESKCHPYFIRKYSKEEKRKGGAKHVATMGIKYLVDRYYHRESWPFFFNSDEICSIASCKGPPGSIGCCQIGEEVDVEEFETKVTVYHTNKL